MGEAEKRKLTSLIISLPVIADKRVGHTTSVLYVDVISTNILLDILANLFVDFDTDYAIPIVGNMPTVSAIDTTIAKSYINLDIIFKEWSLYNSCSLNVVLIESCCKQICNFYNREFLDGMYMLDCVKHILFNVYDRHFHVLALNVHLVDILPAELRLKIDSILEH